MDLQYGTDKSRITGQRSALQDPRVLMEAPRRTFIGEARANKKSHIMVRSRELTGDKLDVV